MTPTPESALQSVEWVDPETSIEAARIANTEVPVAKFTDLIWTLGALPKTPGASLKQVVLVFEGLTSPWLELSRWLAYLWINKPTPLALRNRPGSMRVDYPAAETIRQRFISLRGVIEWLMEQGVAEADEVDDEHLTSLALHLREEGASPNLTDRRMEIFEYWQALSPELPPHLRLSEDIQTQLPPAKRQQVGENKTPRIQQSTMGPLLYWARRFIDDFSEQAFTLFDYALTPLALPPDDAGAGWGKRRAEEILLEHLADEGELPTWRTGSGEIGAYYLEWRYGLTKNAIFRARNGNALLKGTVGAKINCPLLYPNPLPEDLELFAHYYDVIPPGKGKSWPRLARLLQAACLIVVSYLTGMRPDEVRRLKPGCAEEVAALPGGGVRYLIHGTVVKRTEEHDGLKSGTRAEVGAVWATIPLAARAIHVAELLRERYAPTSEWLFTNPHNNATMIPSPIATRSIEEFIGLINERIEGIKGLPTISADPKGPITMRRFRRTLAWYIRNQPQGEAALGVQYQHIGTVVGSGYAAAGSTGWAELLDEEGLKARAQVAENLREQFLEGAGISGLAAARASSAIADFDAAGATLMSDSDLRRILSAPGMQIFDNKASLALCVYDPDKALCEKTTIGPSGPADPNLLGCRSGCGNRAMTDTHAELLKERAAHLRSQAKLAPTPMKNRLLRGASEIDERIAQHERERVIPTVPVDEEMTPHE